MFLDEVPDGTKIFVDSNIFIYHFLGISESCTSFLSRAESQDVIAYTSTTVLAEVLHRLMIAEVVGRYNLKPKDALEFLKKAETIPSLEKAENALKEIPQFNVKLLHLPEEAVFQSAELRRKYSLLTNDSLNLYSMLSNHLSDIATNDSDFERVRDIRVWKPR